MPKYPVKCTACQRPDELVMSFSEFEKWKAWEARHPGRGKQCKGCGILSLYRVPSTFTFRFAENE